MSEGSTRVNPRHLDRLAPEVAEVGVERLGARHGEEDEAEHRQADEAVLDEEIDAVAAD